MRWLIFLPIRLLSIATRWGVAGLLWVGLGVALYIVVTAFL